MICLVSVLVLLGGGIACTSKKSEDPSVAVTDPATSPAADTSAPTVGQVSSTNSNGSYITGDSLTLTVTFSESVTVAGGVPSLSLSNGGAGTSASYSSGSGTATLSFTYTVSAGDSISALEYTSTASLSLGGATIKDAAGNSAVLTLPTPTAAGSLSANKSFSINNLSYACTGGATTFTTNMNARAAIGQANLTSGSANTGGAVSAAGMNNPLAMSVYNGKFFISDGNNNRVLVYNSVPVASGATADLVIGQNDFLTSTSGTSAIKFSCPQSLSVLSGYLAVSEWCNNRVSLWNLGSLATGMSASFAIGQPDLTTGTSNTGGIGANNLKNPTSASYLDGKLYITDSGNNRVLVYNSVPNSSGASANFVIGQGSFATSSSGTGASSFSSPIDVSSNGTKLFISDSLNNRVQVFNTLPSASGAIADVSLGGYVGFGNPQTSASMDENIGVLVSGGKLFVANKSSHRIMVWNNIPTNASTAADAILGQPDVTSHSPNQGGSAAANTLSSPHFMYYDGCRLYVADRSNHRVLIY